MSEDSQSVAGTVRLKPGTTFAQLVELYTDETPPAGPTFTDQGYKDGKFSFTLKDDVLDYEVEEGTSWAVVETAEEWADAVATTYAADAWSEFVGYDTVIYRGPTERSILVLKVNEAQDGVIIAHKRLRSATKNLEEFDATIT